MAEENRPQPPQPPPGFQRPGVPGAGNFLDPEVRGEVRESLQETLPDAARKAAGRGREEPSHETTPQAPPRPAHRVGPYPHGDVDLSFIAPNVPPEPVRPRRQQAGRRFYFLPEAAAQTPPPNPG